MLTCREMTQLMTDYLERRMPLGTRLRFQLHLGMCRHCRRYLRQMRLTAKTLGRVPDEAVPSETMDALLEQFKAWKKPS